MTTISTLTAVLQLDRSNFRSGIEGAQSDLDGLEGKAQSMKGAGKALTAGLTLPLAGMAAQSARTAAGFEESMAQSLSVLDDVEEGMEEKLEQTARDVATTTSHSAEDAADAIFYLGSAGMDAAESMEALPEVAEFAEAANLDLATGVDYLTDAESALGDQTEDLTELSDILVGANQQANATVEQFSQSLTNKAAPAMERLGVETEEGVGALSIFADQGVKGDRAGTIFARTIEDLATQSRENADAFEEMGIEVFDADGEMRDMQSIVEELEGSMGDMTTEQQEAALAQLGFNERSQQGIDMLMGNSEALEEYTGNLRDSEGATQDTAEEMRDNFNAELGISRDRLANAGITIGNDLLPYLGILTSMVSGAAERFSNLSSRQQSMIVGVGALAGALGPLLLLAGTLAQSIVALSGAKAALAAVNTGAVVPSLTAVRGAIMGIYTALGPVGIALLALTAVMSGLLAAWRNDWFNMQDHVETAAGGIGRLIDWITEKLSAIPGVDIETEDAEESLRDLASTSEEVAEEATEGTSMDHLEDDMGGVTADDGRLGQGTDSGAEDDLEQMLGGENYGVQGSEDGAEYGRAFEQSASDEIGELEGAKEQLGDELETTDGEIEQIKDEIHDLSYGATSQPEWEQVDQLESQLETLKEERESIESERDEIGTELSELEDSPGIGGMNTDDLPNQSSSQASGPSTSERFSELINEVKGLRGALESMSLRVETGDETLDRVIREEAEVVVDRRDIRNYNNHRA